uniref:Uncharacterized protein n=1 Tax=Arundo donax TaxID=35708 RepID=A0A0A9GM39_ARUDO
MHPLHPCITSYHMQEQNKHREEKAYPDTVFCINS